MSRGYANFSGMEPFTDGWKRTVYSGPASSDHVCRPVIMESEGRKMPNFHYSSGQYGESYVVESERILEHVPAPIVTLVAEYRVSEPGEEEMFKDYTVDKRYTRFGSGYNHPEEFLTKVQDEVSQLTKAALPFSSGRRFWTGQECSNKYSDDSNFKGSDWYKVNTNPARDRHILQYITGTYPMTNSKDVDAFYERPKGHEGSNVSGHQLSNPTNNINSAMEFLQEYAKPTYGKGTYPMTNSKDVDEFYERPKGHKGSNVSGHLLSKPTNNINSAMEFQKESAIPAYGKGTYPMTNSKDVDEFYERPKGHEGSNVSGHQLSKPTNNVNSAMEFLKEPAKPTYGKGTYPLTNSKDVDEFYERPKGHEGSNVSSHQLSKPTNNNNNSDMEFVKESVNTQAKGSSKTKAVPITMTWRNGSNVANQQNKMDSNEDDLEKQGKSPNRSKHKVYSSLANPQQPRFNVPSVQKKEIVHSSPETIDSSEARRLYQYQYGKSPSLPATEEAFEGTITSMDAAMKYKGTLIP